VILHRLQRKDRTSGGKDANPISAVALANVTYLYFNCHCDEDGKLYAK